MSQAVWRLAARWKTTPPRDDRGLPKWEARREARLSPASFASGGPELPGARRACLRTGEASREKTLARTGTEPRGSGMRVVLGRAPKGTARADHRGREATKHECSSWLRFRSADVDRTHRRSRRPRGAFGRTKDTRDLARRKHTPSA